jgi:hypothetical protein
MVMRNRHGGHGDELPPLLRERLRLQLGEPPPVPPLPPPARGRRGWVGDAIVLGLVFLAMAVTNLVVLVLALVILRGPRVVF